MLPLQSRMSPTEIGASSLEKYRIGCATPPSYNVKFCLGRSTTGRFSASVTVTGTNTRSTSTRMGLVRVLRDGSPIDAAELAVWRETCETTWGASCESDCAHAVPASVDKPSASEERRDRKSVV